MSHPPHPKSAKITKALMEMRQYKQIESDLRVPVAVIRNQAARLGMVRVPLTREERLWIAEKRGIDRKLAP